MCIRDRTQRQMWLAGLRGAPVRAKLEDQGLQLDLWRCPWASGLPQSLAGAPGGRPARPLARSETLPMRVGGKRDGGAHP
eukprot:8254573-Pyramimonas_sp.AAC.1